MDILGAADESDRRHAVTATIETLVRRLDNIGMAGQPQVVVGAHVDDRGPAGHADVGVLRALEHPLALVGASLPHAAGLLGEFIAIYMYEHDAPKAERQLHSLSVSRELLQDMESALLSIEQSPDDEELINAIFFAGFGQRILPSSAGRTTMCPTELQYDKGSSPHIRLLPIETRESPRALREFIAESAAKKPAVKKIAAAATKKAPKKAAKKAAPKAGKKAAKKGAE